MARRIKLPLLDERGDMLTNFIIATLATAVLLGVGGPLVLPTIFDRYKLATKLGAEIDAVRQLGIAQSGTGATLYVNSSATSTTFTLYTGRPESGNAIANAETSTTFNGTVSYGGAKQFAVLASSAGAITAQAWTPGNTIAAETACSGSLTFTVATSLSSKTTSAQCQ